MNNDLFNQYFPGQDPEEIMRLIKPIQSSTYDVPISDTTVPMQGRLESLPSQVGGVPSIPEIPPTTGATRSWEEPLAAPVPPPVEPPKPPLEAPKQAPGTSKTAPEGSNPLDTLLQASSPDQEARNKMLESEKSKHLWGALPTALGGLGDAIGNAAAAYGGRGASGTAERIAAGLEKGEAGRKTQFEENLKNDPKSQISEHYRNVLAMMMNTKPTDPKIANLSASHIATTLPEVEKYMAHKLAMEQTKATREATQASKNIALSEKEEQFDLRRKERLGAAVNQLTAGSRKAIGVAATNNMRADRLIETVDNKKIPSQVISMMIGDLAGIYKGGVPDQIQMAHADFPTFQRKLSELESYVTANPQDAHSPKVVKMLYEITKEIKEVDNKVVSDNLGINAAIFQDTIKKYPEWWANLSQQIMYATEAPSESTRGKPEASGKPPSASSGAKQPISTVSSQQEYDALPSGAQYKDANGKTYRKK